MSESLPIGARPSGFADVDSQEDATFFLKILEAQDRQPGIINARATAWEMFSPHRGQRLLDVGCGTGAVVCELARAVSPSGAVVGVDFSEQMLEAARARAAEQKVEVEFVRGDAMALDLIDESFDGARSERTFQHLSDPGKGLAELVRVVRPGGRIVVLDTDWDSIAFDISDRALAMRLRDASSSRFITPDSGRKLYGMFKRAGLSGVEVKPVTMMMTAFRWPGTDFSPLERSVHAAIEDGLFTEEEGTSVIAEAEAADAEGAYFTTLTMYAVAGSKR